MYCVKGDSEKLCMEVNAGVSADVSIRALRGSGGKPVGTSMYWKTVGTDPANAL